MYVNGTFIDSRDELAVVEIGSVDAALCRYYVVH